MIAVLRSVYRRDPCLGLGYGLSSFIASVNVWTAASDEQCRTVAGLLLANRKIASVYHELDHGNDLARIECEARPVGDTWVLNGRKEVVTNLQRADALVIFARTDPKPGSRSHSQLFLDKSTVAPDRMRDLPRFPSTGMRGVQLGGVEFRDCAIPRDNVLGRPGHGIETALRSFQLTRTVLPAVMAGQVDTGLRTTVRHVLGRRLYGRPVAEVPYIRSVLVGAFVDLLTVECFTTVVARAIHLLPTETSVYASAVKHFGAKALMDAMNRLSMVLGAHFYLRRGGVAIFQKLLRDLQPVGFGHAARAACQTTILPQLPMLARRSWRTPEAAPDELFRLDADLPALPFDRLAVTAAGQDHLSGSLLAGLDAEGADHRAVSDLAERFAAELRVLADECAELPPGELGVAAGPRSADLATRYGLVLAASACLSVWRHNGDRDPFLGDPAWLLAALTRLSAQQRGEPADLPEHVERRLYAELMDRHEDVRGFDLTNRRVR
jgi:alkylation response protein AidB-like acyl-CoA dehydrogenase